MEKQWPLQQQKMAILLALVLWLLLKRLQLSKLHCQRAALR